MLKYLIALLLAALTAAPAIAQMSGNAAGDAAGGSGAMEGDSSIQEEPIPEDQRGPGEGLDTQESQMPATGATGEPSETQIPDTQSGESPAQEQSDQGGQY